MSYLALARKWRPRRFEDVRGQGHVVKALAHALDGDRLHPAILLTGTRGVGKTTLARIIAKGLNCETGIGANPCGVCSACRDVNDGRYTDLLEIDAASNTGVDNVRELIDNAQYSPARGRYKVYLIDEVHMLSKGAFNALLKTLEEPPPHVKFILATTDPQKLPITVLSRCLQFNLKRLPVPLIRDNLADILREEGLQAEPGAITEIARAADGSMRDGLSLLDQAIAFASGEGLRAEAVEEMLGTGGRRSLWAVLDALAANDGATLAEALRRLDETGPDYAALLNDLAGWLQRIAVLQLLPEAASEDDDPRLAPLAAQLAVEDVQLWYQTAVLGRRDLAWAPDPRQGFEMAVLRMFALRLDDSAAPSAAPAAGGQPRAGGVTPAAPRSAAPEGPIVMPRAVAPAAPLASAPLPPAFVPPPAVAAVPPVTPPVTPPAARPVVSPVAAPVESPVAPPAAAAAVTVEVATPAIEPAAPQAADALSAALSWAEQVEALGLDGFTRELARHSAVLDEADGRLRLALEAKGRHLLTEERRAAIEQALVRLRGAPLRVLIEVGIHSEAMSPVAAREAAAIERQRAAEAAIEADPVVRNFREAFGATVRPGSVQPID